MTNREYFGQMAESLANVEDVDGWLYILAYGEFPDYPLKRYPYWPELIGHCLDVVQEWAADEFLGAQTCALVMNAGMQRLWAKRGVRAPGPWLPVIRTLRQYPQSDKIRLPENEQP